MKPIIRNVIAREVEGRARGRMEVHHGASPADIKHALANAKAAALDVETRGNDPGAVETIGICATPGEAFVTSPSAGVLAVLQEWLDDPMHVIGGHNLGYDYEAMLRMGLKVKAHPFCTMIAGAMIHPPLGRAKKMRWHSLEQNVLRYLAGWPVWKPYRAKNSSVVDWTVPNALYRAWFPNVPAFAYEEQYCGVDVGLTRYLMDAQVEYLKFMGMWDLFLRVVMPCLPVLVRMRMNGIALDVERRDMLREHEEEQYAEARERVLERAAALHDLRRARLSEAIGRLEAERDQVFDNVHAVCGNPKHSDYRGATKRASCAGCVAVYQSAAEARSERKDIVARIAKGRARLRSIGEGFKASNPNAWRHLLFASPEEGGLGLIPPGHARTEGGGISVKMPVIEQLMAKYAGKPGREAACELLGDRIVVAHALKRWNPKTGKGSLAIEPEADGRVHFTFSLHRAAGRLASGMDDDEDDKVRKSPGNLHNQSEYDRSIYCAGGPGRVCLSYDYAQIEAWITAWLARDTKMLKLWQKAWECRAAQTKVPDEYDVHCLAAALIFGVEPSDTRKRLVPFEGRMVSMRYAAKRMRHGKNYGMGPDKAARMYGLDIEQAERIWKADDAAWPATAAWRDATAKRAAEDRSLRNVFGRLHPFLSWVQDRKTGEWVFEDREKALAHGPQTGASEMFKVVMVDVERIGDELRAIMVNCPHDALWQEAEERVVDILVPRVVKSMEREFPEFGPIEGFGLFRCPVDVEAGYNFGKRHARHTDECVKGCVLNLNGLIGLEEWRHDKPILA